MDAVDKQELKELAELKGRFSAHENNFREIKDDVDERLGKVEEAIANINISLVKIGSRVRLVGIILGVMIAAIQGGTVVYDKFMVKSYTDPLPGYAHDWRSAYDKHADAKPEDPFKADDF